MVTARSAMVVQKAVWLRTMRWVPAIISIVTSAWASFWRLYVYVELILAAFVVLWFTVGGLRDLKSMLGRLSSMERDDADDGVVRHVDEVASNDATKRG